MKKIILIALASLLYSYINAQVQAEKSLVPCTKENYKDVFTFHPPVKNYYAGTPFIDHLQKSKAQKTWAWILTGVGVGIVAVGLATQDYVDVFSDVAGEKNSTSPVVYATGGAFVAGGIVLFAASAKNKKKSINGSAFFKMEKNTSLQQNIPAVSMYPAVGIRMQLH